MQSTECVGDCLKGVVQEHPEGSDWQSACEQVEDPRRKQGKRFSITSIWLTIPSVRTRVISSMNAGQVCNCSEQVYVHRKRPSDELQFGQTCVNREHSEAIQAFHSGWKHSGASAARTANTDCWNTRSGVSSTFSISPDWHNAHDSSPISCREDRV